MPPRPLPFHWIFPCGQLVLCWFMIAVTYFLPPLWIFHFPIMRLVRTVNFPGGLLTLPIEIYRADHSPWHPAIIEQNTWLAITWPVQAIVFWWIAGRAAEALLNLRYRQLTPRMTRWETVPAFLIMLAGAFLVGGALVMERSQIYATYEFALFAIAGGLWTFLGGLTVVAYFRQWRLLRQNATSAVGAK
jgi:hypothetical protein